MTTKLNIRCKYYASYDKNLILMKNFSITQSFTLFVTKLSELLFF